MIELIRTESVCRLRRPGRFRRWVPAPEPVQTKLHARRDADFPAAPRHQRIPRPATDRPETTPPPAFRTLACWAVRLRPSAQSAAGTPWWFYREWGDR